MAKLLPGSIMFTGKIADLSFYTMRGSDRVIIRSKGGASKEKINNSPRFARTRLNNSEFAGRSTAGKWIRRALDPLKKIADQNLAGPLNSLLRPIQLMDTESKKGERAVYISRNPGLLEGFNFNKKTFFESMIRNPVKYTLSKDSLHAEIEFPELLKDINFYLPEGNFPFYRLRAVMGIVPDILYIGGEFEIPIGFTPLNTALAETEWIRVSKSAPPVKLGMQLQGDKPDDPFTLLVAVGVQLGRTTSTNSINAINYVGSAKILAAV